MFVIDKLSTNVQIFDKQGKFISKFGSKGTGDGQFIRPEDIAIDPQGRIFVCDTGNSRIQIFSTSNGLSTKDLSSNNSSTKASLNDKVNNFT